MAKTYRLTAKGTEALAGKMKGQQALIQADLAENPNSTAEQIAERIKVNLTTRQDPVRVVAFYMATWKKKGFIDVTGDFVGEGIEKNDQPAITPDMEDINSEAPVPTENLGTTAPVGDTAGEAPKQTLSEFISAFAQRRGENGFWPDDVVAEANGDVTKKQVQDSLRRLVGRGELVRADSGEYYHASVVPAQPVSETAE